MSETKPSTTREALIAELLGDIHVATQKITDAVAAATALENTMGASSAALITATENYRAGVNDMLARVRVETSAMLTTTTEHAAAAVVGQQTAVLQAAATAAVQTAIAEGLGDKLRLYLICGVLASGALSACLVVLALKLFG